MVSRPFTRAQLIDQIENLLQDSSNTVWTAAFHGLLLDDALIEISEYAPYISRDIYQMESRHGTATSTSANNLVDATNAQFVSAAADAGKVVYNKTDKTWAVIETFSSTSQVGLSKDIFTVGEQYEIYNKGCWNKRQINIENSDDFIKIIGAAYPVNPDYNELSWQNLHNVKLYERTHILEIDTGFVDDTKDSDADKDVYVYFARQHKLNSMTDLAGAVNNGAGYAAGDTTMALDGLGNTEVIYKGNLFTVALASGITSRLTYRVTADVTTSGNAATVSFWPGLEAALLDDAVVTFVGSTLTPTLERLVVQIVAGEALMSEGIDNINKFARGGAGVPDRFYNRGNNMVEKARKELKALIDPDLWANHQLSR